MVHDALEMMFWLPSYLSSLTPITMVMSSPLAGAEMMTFLAPASRWPLALAASVKMPVDSTTMSTPRSPQGSSESGPRCARALILLVADDDRVVTFERDVLRQPTEDGVVLQQVCQARVVRQVVDRDDLDVSGAERLLRIDGTEEVTADPAESVYANPNGHYELLSCGCAGPSLARLRQ